MSEFTDLQARIQEAVASVETAKQRVFVGRDKVRTLDLAKARVARGKGVRSEEYRSLVEQQRETERGIASERSRLVTTLDKVVAAHEPPIEVSGVPTGGPGRSGRRVGQPR